MMKRIFFYDISSKSWQDGSKSAYASKEIEAIPVHLVILKHDGTDEAQPIVWCPEHQAYETVSECHGFELATTAGCKLQGLFGEGCTWKGEHPPKLSDISLRWQVTWQQDKDIVLLTRDIPSIAWPTILDKVSHHVVNIPRIRHYRTESLALRLSDTMIHPQSSCQEIPVPVAEAALAFLTESAERKFGCQPQLPPSLHSQPFAKGRERLEAFLHYPFDVNLWLLKKFFFEENRQDKLFDPLSKDSFSQLCHLLGLAPSDFLRQWHQQHPFALIMTSLLQKLGIKKEKLVQPFLTLLDAPDDDRADGCRLVLKAYDYHLSQDSLFPTDIFADDEEVRIMLLLCDKGWHRPDFSRLVFYCQWYLFQTDEEKLASHLLYLLENWQPYYFKFMDAFYHHYPDIPLDIRLGLLENGLSPDSEDIVMKAINERKNSEPDFHYTEEQKAYACEIDGFEFRLISYSAEFLGLMKTAHYSSPPNSPTLKDDGALRLGIFRQGRLIACLMLHGSIQVIRNHSGYIHEHTISSAALRTALLHWLKWTGLYKSYGPYYESDHEILAQTVEARPLPAKDL